MGFQLQTNPSLATKLCINQLLSLTFLSSMTFLAPTHALHANLNCQTPFHLTVQASNLTAPEPSPQFSNTAHAAIQQPAVPAESFDIASAACSMVIKGMIAMHESVGASDDQHFEVGAALVAYTADQMQDFISARCE